MTHLLYDPETDGATSEPEVNHVRCDFCGGEGTVSFGVNGYDFDYPCPRCKK